MLIKPILYIFYPLFWCCLSRIVDHFLPDAILLLSGRREAVFLIAFQHDSPPHRGPLPLLLMCYFLLLYVSSSPFFFVYPPHPGVFCGPRFVLASHSYSLTPRHIFFNPLSNTFTLRHLE